MFPRFFFSLSFLFHLMNIYVSRRLKNHVDWHKTDLSFIPLFFFSFFIDLSLVIQKKDASIKSPKKLGFTDKINKVSILFPLFFYQNNTWWYIFLTPSIITWEKVCIHWFCWFFSIFYHYLSQNLHCFFRTMDHFEENEVFMIFFI